MSDWFERYGIVGIYFMVLSIAWFLPFYFTEQYLFNWNEVPGHDTGKLRDYLEQNFGVTWVRQADLKKSITTRV